MKTIGDRIREARLAAKLTQPQLAERAGVSKGTVSMWETGITHPKGANLLKLAEVLNQTPDFLMSGGFINEPAAEYVVVEELRRPSKMVPLISWVQAGAWCEAPDNYAPGDAEEWLSCPSRHSERTYALKVVGDSMTSSIPGEKSYPHGTIIFIDPERAVEVGSRIIARLPNSSEVTFKVYTMDAGVPYLMPINTRYPALPMPEGAHICGVVIGSYWPE